MNDDPHAHHEKHLQLGTDLALDDRRPMTDAEKDAAWAEATTVEEERARYDELDAHRQSLGHSHEEYAALWS